MSSNTSKCEVFRITRKSAPVKTTYLILDHPLQLVKYLGVILSDKQSWTLHIEMVTKMANNTLAFLRRNISRCPRDVNVRCYESLGRPNLEYARLHHGQHTTTGSRTKASRSFCQWRLPHYKQCFKHDEHHRLEVPSTPPPTIQACYAVSHYQPISCHIQPYIQPYFVTTKGRQLGYLIQF